MIFQFFSNLKTIHVKFLFVFYLNLILIYFPYFWFLLLNFISYLCFFALNFSFSHILCFVFPANDFGWTETKVRFVLAKHNHQSNSSAKKTCHLNFTRFLYIIFSINSLSSLSTIDLNVFRTSTYLLESIIFLFIFRLICFQTHWARMNCYISLRSAHCQDNRLFFKFIQSEFNQMTEFSLCKSDIYNVLVLLSSIF